MPNIPPSISVVVPAYNAQRTLAACLSSLLAQTYPRECYELIVVDDGSTDGTAALLDGFVVRRAHSARRGPAAARNLGIAMSSAEIVAFTDADCVAHPDWLAELARAYADPAVGAVGGSIATYKRSRQSKLERFCDEHLPLVNYLSGPAEFLPHLYTANASYRRELLVRLGGFNAGLFTGEDVDLAWRMQLSSAYALRYAEEAIIYHHHRATLRGLAKQYRQYGFGEIMLDTLYGGYAGYPRTRGFQLARMLGQARALPRYMASALVRRLRQAAGRETEYGALVPLLWLLIEASNLRGKLEALWATGWMSQTEALMAEDRSLYLQRYY